jgi:hypothetical protein
MSRELRVYPLRLDIDELMIDLKEKFDIKIYREKSAALEPVELASPV